MKCNTCGGSSNNESFCEYCGTLFETSIKGKVWSDSTEKNDQLSNYLFLASSAQETTNHKEAINYYNKALELDSQLSEAWFGKGYCAGWSGSLASIRIGEMASCFKKAIQFVHDSEKEELIKRISYSITNNALAIYKLSHSHTKEFASVNGTYQEHINRVISVLENLEWAYELNQESKATVKTISDITEQFMAPIYYEVGYGKEKKTVGHQLSSEYLNKVNALRVKYSKILLDKDSNYKNKLETDLQKLKNWAVFWGVFAGLGAVLPFLFIETSFIAIFLSVSLGIVGIISFVNNSKQQKHIQDVLS
jgi:tetratricopeptide (TPR) repeat protein